MTISTISVTMPATVLAPVEVTLRRRGIVTGQYVAYPLKFHEDLIRRMLEYGIRVWLGDAAVLGHDPAIILKRAHTGKSHWTIAPKGGRRRKEMFVTKSRRPRK